MGDGARGCETVQKDTGLVEKVESLEDISVRHACWIIRHLVLVLVLGHDFDNRNRIEGNNCGGEAKQSTASLSYKKPVQRPEYMPLASAVRHCSETTQNENPTSTKVTTRMSLGVARRKRP